MYNTYTILSVSQQFHKINIWTCTKMVNEISVLPCLSSPSIPPSFILSCPHFLSLSTSILPLPLFLHPPPPPLPYYTPPLFSLSKPLPCPVHRAHHTCWKGTLMSLPLQALVQYHPSPSTPLPHPLSIGLPSDPTTPLLPGNNLPLTNLHPPCPLVRVWALLSFPYRPTPTPEHLSSPDLTLQGCLTVSVPQCVCVCVCVCVWMYTCTCLVARSCML